MEDVLLLGAGQLLALPADRPERLFEGDEAALRQTWRRLAAKWHPDRNADPRAALVFDRLHRLYEEACRRLEERRRLAPGTEEFRATDGRLFRLRYRRRRRFELGEMFIAERHLAFRIEREHLDLWRQGLRRITALRFADEAMRGQVQSSLPQVETSFETADGAVAVLRKDPDLVLLDDLLARLGGKPDPRHVAWILSRLYGLACYLEYAGIAHHAIASDTWWVSPARHTGALLGGWWYAAPEGEPLRALPGSSAACLPQRLLDARRASGEIDLELIHALGREMLGEPGIGFLARVDLPPPMYRALRMPPAEDAVSAFRQWRGVLEFSFGRPKFVKLAITFNDIYKEH